MPRSHLSDEDRAALIGRYQAGETKAALAAAFGVPVSTVRSHPIGGVRPAKAAARFDALQRELIRHVPIVGQDIPLFPAHQALVRKRWRDGATAAALAATVAVPEAVIAHRVDHGARPPRGAQRERARQAATTRAARRVPGCMPARRRSPSVRRVVAAVRFASAATCIDLGRAGAAGCTTLWRALPVLPWTTLERRHPWQERDATITRGAATRAAVRLPPAGLFPARSHASRQPHLLVQVPPPPPARGDS